MNVRNRWAFLVAIAVLAPCCHDDDNDVDAIGGAAWWNLSPDFNVATSTPGDGATQVVLCSPVSVSFNRDADPATVNATTFTATAGGPVTGTVVYTAATRTATFTPAGGFWAGSTLHTVNLTGGILSTTGQPLSPRTFTFTSVALFGRVSSNPASGATGVPINTTVSVTFNKPVNAGTLATADFRWSTGSTFLFASHTYDVPSRTLTLSIAPSNFPASTPITVSVLPGSVETGDGCLEQLLPVNFNFSFTTGTTGDTIPPTFAGAQSASAPNNVSILVTWAAASDNVTPASSIVYRVYRDASPFGSFPFRGQTPAGALSFTDSVPTGSTFFYRVQARDASFNETNNTATVSATAVWTWTAVYTSIISGGGYGCTGCHGSVSGSGGLEMGSQSQAYNELVNVSGPCSATRVIPSNGLGSLLYQKAANTQTCGNRMPPPTFGAQMAAPDAQAILDWINRGAPND